VFVEDIVDPESLVGTAQRVVQLVSEPYHVSGHDIFVTGSIGISTYPNDGKTISELVKTPTPRCTKSRSKVRTPSILPRR
jgi:GGDEF domain-containing protein